MNRRRTQIGRFLLMGVLCSASVAAIDRRVEAQAITDNEVHLRFTFGSEKKDWLNAATQEFHRDERRTSQGKLIKVELVAMGSGQLVEEVLEAQKEVDLPAARRVTPRAHLVSPASEIYIRLGNAGKIRRKVDQAVLPGDRSLVEQTRSLVTSPVVIGMWKSNALALGWNNPSKPALGWGTILQLVRDPKGWASWDHPDFGKLIFAHTNPQFSNSGLLAIIEQVFAATGKTNGLTIEDVHSEKTRKFLAEIAGSINLYGESTGFLGDRMIYGEPTELHAAVMYESMVIGSYQDKEIDDPFRPGQKFRPSKNPRSPHNQIVAIYPVEGTFWSDHPVGIVDASWVSKEQREAADLYIDYLLQKPRQDLAMDFGFRPGIKGIPLNGKFSPSYGVDPAEPKSELRELPDLDVIAEIRNLWRREKKRSDVVLAIDVSNSMVQDGKIEQAKEAATQLSGLFGDDDRLSILTFGDKVQWKERELPMDDPMARLKATEAVAGLRLENKTSLYDGVRQAWQALLPQAGPDRISLIIVLSDGVDTVSKIDFARLKKELAYDRLRPVIIVTIGYGKDANPAILKQIADLGRGPFEPSTPGQLQKVIQKVIGIGGPGQKERVPDVPR